MSSKLAKKLCITSALSGAAFIGLIVVFAQYAGNDDDTAPAPTPDVTPAPEPQPAPAPDFATAADECAMAMIERRMLPMIANQIEGFHLFNSIEIYQSTADFLQRVDDVAAYQLSICEDETGTEITSATDEHLQQLEDAKQGFAMTFPNQ